MSMETTQQITNKKMDAVEREVVGAMEVVGGRTNMVMAGGLERVEVGRAEECMKDGDWWEDDWKGDIGDGPNDGCKREGREREIDTGGAATQRPS